MDMKKIGSFLKELRKERGLTQEQLAEILAVSSRTVSRWETGTNMPDLSILIQIAEFYHVEIKEILDGERKSENMDKELKETLVKVADYSKIEKEKAQKIGGIAFGISFFVCAVAILVQMILAGNLYLVAGETATLLIGGITYIALMVHNGIWETGSDVKSTPGRDLLISVVCAAGFTLVLISTYLRMGAEVSKASRAGGLFFVGILLICFLILRILAFFSSKKRAKRMKINTPEKQEIPPANIYVADGTIQAEMILEALKQNGIPAYKQDLGDAGFASVRCGIARGIDDRIAIFVPEEMAEKGQRVLEEMGI